MKILFLLFLALKGEENLIHTYKNTYVYAYWDSINLYLKIRVSEFEKFLFATGEGEEGEYYFPDLMISKKFPLKLNNFLKLDLVYNTKTIKGKDISFKIDTLEKFYLINLIIPQKVYENPEYVYFWFGFEIKSKGIFYTIPEEKENFFPIFAIPVDQDRDGKWDKGLNLKALTRIKYLKENEENLNFKKVKKFFNPDIENLEIEIEGIFDLNNLKVAVYSLTGKKIKELQIEKGGDKIRIVWDGKDESGKVQKPGVYLIVVKTASGVEAQVPVVIFR